VVVGAAAMLLGYFSVETPLFGLGPALLELVTVNSVQVLSGAVISLTLAQIILKALPDIKFMEFRKESTRTGVAIVVLVAIIMAVIVGVYVMSGISP
jgi:hypothetical protein